MSTDRLPRPPFGAGSTQIRPHSAGDWGRLLALVAMWGSAFLLTKVAVASLDPRLVVAGRLVVACAILLPLAAFAASVGRRPGREQGTWGPKLWLFLTLIALFGNALPFSLMSWGQQAIDSGLAGILMAVMPLATLGLAHRFVPGERLTPYRIGGFLLGFSGVTVLMGPESLLAAGTGDGALLPMLAVLGGALCYSISAILARLRPPSDSLPSAAATVLIASVLTVPLAMAGGAGSSPIATAPGGPSWAALAAVLGLGVFSTAWASVLYLSLVKRAGPAFVSQLNYLIPLWALLGGILFLGERPERSHLYALGLILSGILVTQLERRGRRGRRKTRPAP